MTGVFEYFLSAFFSGYVIAYFMKISYSEKFIYSFPLGFGVISIAMFFSSLVTNSFMLSYSAIMLGMLLGILLFMKDVKKIVEIKMRFDYKIPLLITVLFLSIFCVNPFIKMPFLAWDAWALWGLQAKFLFFNQHIPLELFTVPNRFLTYLVHPAYPLNLALNESFFATVLGGFDEARIKLISPFFSLFFYFAVYKQLKLYLSKRLNLMLMLIILSLPIINLHSVGYYAGCSDVIVMFYNTAALLSMLKYYNSGENRYFYLSSIFCGLSMWTKLEGIFAWIALVIAGIYLFGRSKSFSIVLKYSILPVLMNVGWYAVRILHHIPFQHHLACSHFPLRMWTVLSAIGKELFMFYKWGPFWIVIFILMLANIFVKDKIKNFFLIVLLIELLLYLFTLTCHRQLFYFVSFYPACPLDRLLLHLVGYSFIFMAYTFKRAVTDSNNVHYS